MHNGNSLRGGHYTTSVETPDGEWYFADDKRISQIEKEKALDMAAQHCYILFYDKFDGGNNEPTDVSNTMSRYTVETALHKNAEEEIVATIEDLQIREKYLKTMEYPQKDFSYSRKPAGWINDNIVCAVLKHIEIDARKEGLHIKAMGTTLTFIQSMKNFNDPNLTPLARKHVFEKLQRLLKNCDIPNTHMYIVPCHLDNNHWTMYIVNNRKFIFMIQWENISEINGRLLLTCQNWN